MNSSSDIAIVSVITSGIVAVAGLLIPLLANLVLDSRKWSREQKAATMEKLNSSTTELLNKIAEVSNAHWEHQSQKPFYPSLAECVGAFYAWEQLIWARCTHDDQQKIEGIRSQLEKATNLQTFSQLAPTLIRDIIEISHSIGGRH